MKTNDDKENVPGKSTQVATSPQGSAQQASQGPSSSASPNDMPVVTGIQLPPDQGNIKGSPNKNTPPPAFHAIDELELPQEPAGLPTGNLPQFRNPPGHHPATGMHMPFQPPPGHQGPPRRPRPPSSSNIPRIPTGHFHSPHPNQPGSPYQRPGAHLQGPPNQHIPGRPGASTGTNYPQIPQGGPPPGHFQGPPQHYQGPHGPTRPSTGSFPNPHYAPSNHSMQGAPQGNFPPPPGTHHPGVPQTRPRHPSSGNIPRIPSGQFTGIPGQPHPAPLHRPPTGSHPNPLMGGGPLRPPTGSNPKPVYSNPSLAGLPPFQTGNFPAPPGQAHFPQPPGNMPRVPSGQFTGIPRGQVPQQGHFQRTASSLSMPYPQHGHLQQPVAPATQEEPPLQSFLALLNNNDIKRQLEAFQEIKQAETRQLWVKSLAQKYEVNLLEILARLATLPSEIKGYACEILGTIGKQEIQPYLEREANNELIFIRLEALRAMTKLERLDLTETLKVLLKKVLQDETIHIRLAAIQLLPKLYKQGLPIFMEIFNEGTYEKWGEKELRLFLKILIIVSGRFPDLMVFFTQVLLLQHTRWISEQREDILFAAIEELHNSQDNKAARVLQKLLEKGPPTLQDSIQKILQQQK